MAIINNHANNNSCMTQLDGLGKKPQGKLHGANGDGYARMLLLTTGDIQDGGATSPKRKSGATSEMSLLKLLQGTMLMSFMTGLIGSGREKSPVPTQQGTKETKQTQGQRETAPEKPAPEAKKPPADDPGLVEVHHVDKKGKLISKTIAGREQDTSTKPTGNTGRPPGDNRTAEEIINANPALKKLGNQKDIKREELKKQCGDWTDKNPDPKSRADAAYNMSKVLNWIDSSKNREGGDRESKVKNGLGDGNIEGITKDGDARHGTEAGNLKDFAEKGYSALKDDHRLDKTKDSHVKLDGSNYNNFQWGVKKVKDGLDKVVKPIGDLIHKIEEKLPFMKKVFNVLKYVPLPGLGGLNMLKEGYNKLNGTLDRMEKSDGNIGDALLEGAKGYAGETYNHHAYMPGTSFLKKFSDSKGNFGESLLDGLKGGAGDLFNMFKKGKISPHAVIQEMVEREIRHVVNLSVASGKDESPDPGHAVKKTI